MNNKNNLKQNILDRIEKGDVSMKPKMYFIGKTVVYALGAMIVLLAILFLVSFVLFTLRAQGLFFLPEFGLRGLMPLLLSIPWLLVLLIIMFVAILELLARNFSFVYKKPLVYSILGIIVLAVFAGGAIAATPLHERMYNRAEIEGIPLGGTRFYKQYMNADFKGGYAGTVEKINSNGIELLTPSGRTVFVSTTTNTKYPKNYEFEEGSLIIVVGENSGKSFEAFGIRTIDESDRPFMHQKMGPGPGEKRLDVPRKFQ